MSITNLAPLAGRYWCNEHGLVFVVDGDAVRSATSDESAEAHRLFMKQRCPKCSQPRDEHLMARDGSWECPVPSAT